MPTIYFQAATDAHNAAQLLTKVIGEGLVASAQMRIYRGATKTRCLNLASDNQEEFINQFRSELSEAERQSTRPIAYWYRNNDEVDFFDIVAAAKETIIGYGGCCIVALLLGSFTDYRRAEGAVFLFFEDFADAEMWRESHEGRAFDLSDMISDTED